MTATKIVWPDTEPSQKFRSPISHNGTILEGVFVEMFYRQSMLASLNPFVNLSLIADGVRLVGVDIGGMKSHTNKVGSSMPYYRHRVYQPHIHFPVPDGVYGYCEPLDEKLDLDSVWQIFLDHANIKTAPAFELPSLEQGKLL